MDDSDIVVLDDSTEEQPSTSRNVFSIASPAVCQRWTQPSSAQPPMRQRTSHTTWHKTFNPPFDYQPQPVITSVTSLSPSRNRPIIISEIRPTSVSKKDDPPVADAATILQEFKNACLAAADNEFDMKAILDKKVEKSFNNTSQAFKKTSSFHTLLSNKLQKVKTDPTNVYVHISELVTELKARKASKEEGEEPPTKKIKSSSKVSKNVDYDALENARDEMKMKKLSKTLKKLQKIIKKLEQKEVDWEDDSDSAYIILQRYKQRAVKVFQKLCDYTKESKSAGNLNKIHLSKGTCFPKVNKCVENFVNKTGQFPDFVDILELMKESNEKDNMKLQEYEIEDMAKKVFEEVGGELQKQRKHGVADSLLVFMEDEKGDPAEDSTELKEKLNENAKHWTKINEIIDDFAMRAKEKKGNETESKSDDDDEEEEEEEEDDDDAEAESGKEDLEEIDVPDILKGENEIDSEKSDNEEEESRDLEEEPVPADCS
ncbi:death domain-associated protein 6-like isoform X2 [Thrips palmi]|uniref:Death domain-associated protein 6-like isoform X2 n=1 Tax=Thrips palmi TaxID=161013 RepID=A0A6P8YA14_THRPL|nr:death domain-associated protein 6-like isoform X2 [Thrips palmi]